MAWQTLDDCLTLDTKGLMEFISANENTKRFLLQAIGKIFDPLGLLIPFTIGFKCLIQELWEKKITFVSNCKNLENKRKGQPTSEDLSEAEHYLIKQYQFEAFSAEVTAMMSGDNISNKTLKRSVSMLGTVQQRIPRLPLLDDFTPKSGVRQ
ncbi:hypothetical protein AVEN_266886-1 [Araneus ventricosus]|uniref:Uncharacterized protein n=1 Tax=Araneus ventricosus TaxID=182803 RepID=A0A4Y2I1D4_ARAVE|nr:hypothetical protein AVEN_266886-1 [Araneus ventricosus]